jgi:hypothetical protein
MKNKNILSILIVIIFTSAILISGCSNPPPPTEVKESKKELTNEERIERGEYIVSTGLCNDCHSPKIMTPQGPVVDTTRLLSGTPQDIKLPKINPAEITPGKWYLGSSDLTSWVGPWGISFAANLTPDSSTGIGAWTEDLFIKILRTGKFMGVDAGRPIMPPMPWDMIGKKTDEDLKNIFAYLKSLPPIKNTVPAYVPPNEIAKLK